MSFELVRQITVVAAPCMFLALIVGMIFMAMKQDREEQRKDEQK